MPLFMAARAAQRLRSVPGDDTWSAVSSAFDASTHLPGPFTGPRETSPGPRGIVVCAPCTGRREERGYVTHSTGGRCRGGAGAESGPTAPTGAGGHVCPLRPAPPPCLRPTARMLMALGNTEDGRLRPSRRGPVQSPAVRSRREGGLSVHH